MPGEGISRDNVGRTLSIYITKQGDCFASIAKQHGFHEADVIYQHPSNTDLKAHRPNLHVLNTGEHVVVPNKTVKTIEIPSQTSSVFTIQGLLCELKLVIEDFDGNPLANTHYSLDVEGAQYNGQSDESGMLIEKIDASAKKAKLFIFLDSYQKDTLFWPLELGGLTAHSDVSGIQARLNNLGYFCNNETGELDSSTKRAVNEFKINNDLANDSVIDFEFTSKLLSVYGI